MRCNVPSKARRDTKLSERFYKVCSIFLQNGDFDVTVGKFVAKTLKRDFGDVIVGTKNSNKRVSKTNRIEPTLTTLAHTDLSTSLGPNFTKKVLNYSLLKTFLFLTKNYPNRVSLMQKLGNFLANV